MIVEMRDQVGDVYLFAGNDLSGEPTFARTGRHGITPAEVVTYRVCHPSDSIYHTVELWASRERYLYPVEHPTVPPQDALMGRVQDLLLHSPSCPTESIRMLTDLQSAVWELDQHLVAGGVLPRRWQDGIRVPE
jgi:hypothetical protein